MNERPVVAGVDGSPPSLIAAEHAAVAAVALGVPLQLVHGYLHPGSYGAAVLTPYDLTPPPAPEEGEGFLSDLAAHLRTTYPGLTVTAKQVLGGAAAALLAESTDASLLVVGSRGLGGFSGMLLGSVSAHVVAHARCPVLVVRPPIPPATRPDAPVIAGVDGSAGSLRAVRYAAGEAARRGRKLILVHAGVGAAEADRTRAQELLDEAAGQAAQAHPEVQVSTEIRYGADAADGKVEASKQAAVVVVGSRGRGGFLGLLLGSISQALVHHAHCPVLVVPPRVDERRLVPTGGEVAAAAAGPDRG
ncbi:MAG TPA: universal stress protein [Natronosporangium sp.]|nr:universal stress protein [Natronosporangium sp.]